MSAGPPLVLLPGLPCAPALWRHPTDTPAAAARAGLTRAVQVISQTSDLCPLGIPPEDLAAKALAGLPN